MRQLLTIGELANFLNTSTFNIRYYEKEGLIEPKKINEKGYRLYDYDEMLKYNIIMLLRDSNIPIKEIKILLEDFTPSKYKEALQKSKKHINEEIKRLINLREEVNQREVSLEYLDTDVESYEVKYIEDRTIYHINSINTNIRIPLKELYDIYRKKSIDFSRIHSKDDYYILSEKAFIYGFRDESDKYAFDSTIFPSGQYLCYRFKVTSDDDYDKHYKKIVTYLKDMQLDTSNQMILKISPTSVINAELFIAEYQMQIISSLSD